MIMLGTSSPPSMMTPESDADTGPPLSPANDQNCRAVVRQLLDACTSDELHRIVQEESTFLSTGAYQSPDLTRLPLYSNSASENASTARRSSAGQAGSVPSSSGRSARQQQTPSSKPTRPNPNASLSQKSRGRQDPESSARVVSTSQRLDYACGFCAEEDIRKTCTRRNDLRRHIENFHNSSAVWFCQHPGCRMAFDWQTAYQNHLRNSHGRSHMNVDEAKVKLCDQVVFACGFEGCSQVFEAPSEGDASATMRAYSGHIVKHFEEGSNGGRWTYSTRIRNLLQQPKVRLAWDRSWPEAERAKLQWETQSSLALRRLLETRHLDNLPFMIQFALMLGSDPSKAADFESQLELPIKDNCPSAAYKHDISSRSRGPSPRTEGEESNGSRRPPLHYQSTVPMPPGQQIPRSIGSSNTIHATDLEQSGYTAPPPSSQAPQAAPAPSQMFYSSPVASSMYATPTGLPMTQQAQAQAHRGHGHHQHYATMGTAGANSLGFPSMQATHNVSNAMDVDLTENMPEGEPAGISPSHARSNWVGGYGQYSMQGPIPTDAYMVTNSLSPEQSHMNGGYDSPRRP